MKYKNALLATKSILLLTVSILFGCAASYKALPDIPVLRISEYKNYQKNSIVAVAIDLFIEPERLVRYFGTDLIYYGLLPIHILIENNENNPLLLHKENIVLFNAENQPILQDPLSFTKTPIEKERREERIMLGSITGGAVLFPPLAFVSLIDARREADAQTITHNLSSKSLYDKSIFKGEMHHCFVYFPLNDIIGRPDKSILQIKIKSQAIENTHTVRFDINTAELNQRVMELYSTKKDKIE